MPLDALLEPLGIKRAAHLLRRATFGPTKERVDQFAVMTPQEALELLFADGLPEPTLPIDPATGTEWITAPPSENNSEESDLLGFLRGWMVGQMINGGEMDPLTETAYNVREKITFFLHSHFTTQLSKVRSSKGLYYQNQLFRLFAFDRGLGTPEEPNWKNFRSLAKKICIDNAMLWFLDGRLNVEGSPNENFAREFFELYTAGRGLEGAFPSSPDQGDYFTFTEQDVQEAARIFSGFTIDPDFGHLDEDTSLPRGVVRGGQLASAHDNDPKQLSHRFGDASIIPDPTLQLGGEATEASALDEISQLVDVVFSQSETARHICRKIYRFYVHYEITQELDDTIISGLAQTFVDSEYSIQAVIEEIFTSEHFYNGPQDDEGKNIGGIIKSPLDLVVGTLRFFESDLPDYANATEEYYQFVGKALGAIEDMGMDFYDPFEVAGYAAYHQYPAYNRNWISTNYLTTRYDFIRRFLPDIHLVGDEFAGFDVLTLIQERFSDEGSDARELVIALTQYLLPFHEELSYDAVGDDLSEITAERLNFFLMAFLFSPQIDPDPEASWKIRWDTQVDTEVLQRQLENLLNGMLQSPEYQLL